jgi:hypothetical protein
VVMLVFLSAAARCNIGLLAKRKEENIKIVK